MNPDEIDKYLEEDSIYKEIFIYQLKKIKRNIETRSIFHIKRMFEIWYG